MLSSTRACHPRTVSCDSAGGCNLGAHVAVLSHPQHGDVVGQPAVRLGERLGAVDQRVDERRTRPIRVRPGQLKQAVLAEALMPCPAYPSNSPSVSSSSP